MSTWECLGAKRQEGYELQANLNPLKHPGLWIWSPVIGRNAYATNPAVMFLAATFRKTEGGSF